MAEWWAQYYGDQYADSVRGLLTPERTAEEVAFIRGVTGLTPPASVADVACGEGRHARLLAAQGAGLHRDRGAVAGLLPLLVDDSPLTRRVAAHALGRIADEVAVPLLLAAAAKALGSEFLDADVTEALPRREGEINLTYYARKEFERFTGLEGIRLTAPWRYHLLHHHIEGYKLYLERSRGREVTLPEAARIWYRTQYLPTLMEIRRRKLTSVTGGRTFGDVYTDLLKQWAEEEGLAISLRELLDRYDRSNNQSALTKAKRMVTGMVDASLPKAVPPLGTPRPRSFTEEDVEAELEGLGVTRADGEVTAE